MVSRIRLMNVAPLFTAALTTLRGERTRNMSGNPGMLHSAQSSELPKTLTMIALSSQRPQALALSPSCTASKRMEFRQNLFLVIFLLLRHRFLVLFPLLPN